MRGTQGERKTWPRGRKAWKGEGENGDDDERM